MNTKVVTFHILLLGVLMSGQVAMAGMIESSTEKLISTRAGSPVLAMPKKDWKVKSEKTGLMAPASTITG